MDLNFNINGDCSSAVAALQNTETAADHLAGRDFSFSVSANGVDDAVREVGRVNAAIAAGGGLVSVGADTSGLDDAHGAVASLRGGVQGLSQDLSGLSGMGLDLGGGSGLSQLAGDLAGFSDGLGTAATRMSDFNEVGSTFGRTSSEFSRSGSMMRQEIESIAGATDGLTASTRELVSVTSDSGQVMNAVKAGGTPGGMFSGGGGGSFGGGFDNSPGGSDGPPTGPPSAGGRGGFGGDGSSGGLGGSLRGLAQPAMMGTMLGGAGSLMAGAGGFMAVEEAIKSSPLLEAAQKNAMDQLKAGVQEGSASAAGEALAGMQNLGPTLRNLGLEVGSIAAAHMGTALSGVESMATTATHALKNLDPAVDSSMKGLTALADSVMNGISNPSTVQAINGVGEMLADPRVESGITNLIGGLGSVAAATATVVGNAAGAVGNVLGVGGDEAEGPIMGAGIGGYLGNKALGKSLGGGLKGGLMGGGIGAGIMGMAAVDQQSGVDPTAGVIGGGLGTGIGVLSKAGGPTTMALAAAGEFLAHNPSLMAGGAFTTPGADTQGAGGGLTERLPSMIGQGASWLWDNASASVGNLMDHGTTTDLPMPGGPGAPTGGAQGGGPPPPPLSGPGSMASMYAFGLSGGGAGLGGGGSQLPTSSAASTAQTDPTHSAWDSVPVDAQGFQAQGNMQNAWDPNFGPAPYYGPEAAQAGKFTYDPAVGDPGHGPIGPNGPVGGYTNQGAINDYNAHQAAPQSALSQGLGSPQGLGAGAGGRSAPGALGGPQSAAGMGAGAGHAAQTGLAQDMGMGAGRTAGPAASALSVLNNALAVNSAFSAQASQQNTALANTVAAFGQSAQSATQSAQSQTAAQVGQNASQQQGQSQNSALGQSISQVGQSANNTTTSLGAMNSSLGMTTQSATDLGQSATAAMAPMAAMPDMANSSAASAIGALNSAAPAMDATASSVGTGAMSSMAAGISSGAGQASDAASSAASGAAGAAASASDSQSPSRVWMSLGGDMTAGMAIGLNNGTSSIAGAATSAIHGVTDAARGVASDSGLMVGYSYVESMLTGTEQAIKTAQFQQLGFADIQGAKAKAALGALGLMGPAGSGAQSYQLSAQEVSFATGTAANPPASQTIVLERQPVYLDGRHIATIADQRINVAFGQFTDQYGRQRDA